MPKPGQKHRGKFVAYYRVSTKRQGASGLGLEAQRQVVQQHLNGGDWDLVAEFTEIESGKRSDRRRPELKKALAQCKADKATLIVAKVDRLTRNLSFLTRLLEADVKMLFCDLPELNNLAQSRFLLQLMANVAELERAQISERTKVSLQAAKRRGVKLGTPDPVAASIAAGKSVRKMAKEYALEVGPVIDELEKYGCTTLNEIAAGLEARGVKTARGKEQWSLSSVRNVRMRWNKVGK